MTEQQIVEGCKKQKREAQKALYERYSRTMYGICLRYCADTDDAKDLLQDGFIKIFSNISSFQEKGSLEGWVKRVFINMALESFRKNKTLIQRIDDVQELSGMVEDDANDSAMAQVSEEELLRMIQELPKGYSTVFNLYAIEDLPHKEIASMLGISEGTSRSQYVRARNLLQEKVRNYIRSNS